jgi:hypothetical protein
MKGNEGASPNDFETSGQKVYEFGTGLSLGRIPLQSNANAGSLLISNGNFTT